MPPRWHGPVGPGAVLEKIEQSRQAEHELAMALGKIHPHLRDERIGERKLGKRKSRDGELADGEHADAKLGNADDAAPELTNGDHATRDDGASIGPVLE